jgi:hypothetical protein
MRYILVGLQPGPLGGAPHLVPAIHFSLNPTLMPKLFTHLRLPLLALLTSFALTSCFDRDKKHDPQPKGWCGTGTTPTTTTTGGGAK